MIALRDNVVGVVALAVAVVVLMVAMAVALTFFSGGFSDRGIWADNSDVCVEKCGPG